MASAMTSAEEAAPGQHGLHPLHRTIDPAFWCVTRQDLDAFEKQVREVWQRGEIPDDAEFPNAWHNDPDIGPSIYQVNKHFIKPATLAAGGMSWALLRNPRGLRCDVFVTHCWAEGIFEFCSKLRRTWPRGSRGLYCCFLANPQNADVGALLGDDPMASPFARALETAQHLVVLPNRRVSIYTRLWCVLEAHVALQRGLRITMPWRPRTRDMQWTLAPAALLFTCAILAWACTPTTTDFVAHVRMWFNVLYEHMSIQIAYLLHSLFVRRLPMLSSSMLLLVVGLEWGVWLWFVRVCGEPCLNGALVAAQFSDLLFGLEGMRCALLALGKEALKQEADQLTFDSVRGAACSWNTDEMRIRAAIRGTEDEIDEAISVLKSVGRYDGAVLFNMRRGMSPTQARVGVSALRLLIIVMEWLVIPWYVRLYLADRRADLSATNLVRPIVFSVSAMLAVLATCVGGNRATFLVNALFWACTLKLIGKGLTRSSPSLSTPGVKLLYKATVLLGAFIACAVFYLDLGWGSLRRLGHSVSPCSSEPDGEPDSQADSDGESSNEAGDEASGP